MNKQEAEELADLIGRRLDDLIPYGIALAEGTKYGCIISSGNMSAADHSKRYMIVMATNDAATDLKKWIDEQAEIRAAAAKKAGVHALTSTKKEWPS